MGDVCGNLHVCAGSWEGRCSLIYDNIKEDICKYQFVIVLFLAPVCD